jgi:hypothetical protein
MTRKGAGHKANETKLAKFGPDEPNRAGRAAAWTKEHGSSAESPHTQERVYKEADRHRWQQFDAWRKANSNRGVWENPFRHPDFEHPPQVAEELAERGVAPEAPQVTDEAAIQLRNTPPNRSPYNTATMLSKILTLTHKPTARNCRAIDMCATRP